MAKGVVNPFEAIFVVKIFFSLGCGGKMSKCKYSAKLTVCIMGFLFYQ